MGNLLLITQYSFQEECHFVGQCNNSRCVASITSRNSGKIVTSPPKTSSLALLSSPTDEIQVIIKNKKRHNEQLRVRENLKQEPSTHPATGFINSSSLVVGCSP